MLIQIVNQNQNLFTKLNPRFEVLDNVPQFLDLITTQQLVWDIFIPENIRYPQGQRGFSLSAGSLHNRNCVFVDRMDYFFL